MIKGLLEKPGPAALFSKVIALGETAIGIALIIILIATDGSPEAREAVDLFCGEADVSGRGETVSPREDAPPGQCYLSVGRWRLPGRVERWL